jgi:hypothetical protein
MGAPDDLVMCAVQLVTDADGATPTGITGQCRAYIRTCSQPHRCATVADASAARGFQVGRRGMHEERTQGPRATKEHEHASEIVGVPTFPTVAVGVRLTSLQSRDYCALALVLLFADMSAIWRTLALALLLCEASVAFASQCQRWFPIDEIGVVARRSHLDAAPRLSVHFVDIEINDEGLTSAGSRGPSLDEFLQCNCSLSFSAVVRCSCLLTPCFLGSVLLSHSRPIIVFFFTCDHHPVSRRTKTVSLLLLALQMCSQHSRTVRGRVMTSPML